MLWFKILDSDGRACCGGDYTYDLPNGKRPGAWTRRIKSTSLCVKGYHIVCTANILDWNGMNAARRLFIAQGRGVFTNEVLGKAVCSQIRLLRELKLPLGGLELQPLVVRKYRRALDAAFRKWPWEKYNTSKRQQVHQRNLICNYVEDKMGWTRKA